MIFGQLRYQPWYGKNTGLVHGLTTSSHHTKLTWDFYLELKRYTRAMRNLGDKPQCAWCPP